MSSGPANHPLFAQAPLSGQVTVGGVDLPTPYHVYDGQGTVLCGACDAAALEPAFAGQDVHPVLTASGQGVLCLFLCDFTQASHGPHLECQVAALASPTPGARISDTPEAPLSAMAMRPDWGLLSVHLWNDTAPVVAYNRDYLGLDAASATGFITRAKGRMTVQFNDASGAPLMTGDLALNRRSDLRSMAALMRLMGVRGIWRAARQKFATAHLINRKGAVLPENRRARTMTAPDTLVITRFRPGRDRFEMVHPALARLGFQPACAEHFSPFRFVYLHPDDS